VMELLSGGWCQGMIVKKGESLCQFGRGGRLQTVGGRLTAMGREERGDGSLLVL
jgi:hypothetical protein